MRLWSKSSPSVVNSSPRRSAFSFMICSIGVFTSNEVPQYESRCMPLAGMADSLQPLDDGQRLSKNDAGLVKETNDLNQRETLIAANWAHIVINPSAVAVECQHQYLLVIRELFEEVTEASSNSSVNLPATCCQHAS